MQIPRTAGVCLAAAAWALWPAAASFGQSDSLPNPYRLAARWYQLPEGRILGSIGGVSVAPDGNVWVLERCGANTCATSQIPPLLEFDPTGRLLHMFGAGLFMFPHGLTIDSSGNLWVADGQGQPGKGYRVFEFSPEGRILMTLGQAGIAGDGPDTFDQPDSVAVAPNGDIFVADGHTPGRRNARVVKFSRNGRFLKQWGGHGSGPGQFEVPHSLAFDSRGRLFVGDRDNNRIQIFDQDGRFLAQWRQFGRPSGIFIDPDDRIYVADSESTEKEGYGHNPGFARGIRIGSAKDGSLTAFIPDSANDIQSVAADAQGNIYAAGVASKDVLKFVRK